MEATSRFELENGGFADLCLTTWLCRLMLWSGRRDLNPRLQPWQGCTLPLSYSRAYARHIHRSFFMEATSRFELENGGFADLCLTTWLCRLMLWSGRRDLNPRLQPWQGCTLPLSYSRAYARHIHRSFFMEATSRFELENGGFADLCLTTWLCRLMLWSGRRDLNPRLQPWQGCTLPLSYSRSTKEGSTLEAPFLSSSFFYFVEK